VTQQHLSSRTFGQESARGRAVGNIHFFVMMETLQHGPRAT